MRVTVLNPICGGAKYLDAFVFFRCAGINGVVKILPMAQLDYMLVVVEKEVVQKLAACVTRAYNN